MKLALVSNVLPPSESAHAAIIERLLRNIDPDSYCLLSSRNYAAEEQSNYSRRLPGKYFYLPPPFQFTRGYRLGLKTLRERINLLLAIKSRTRAIHRILKKEKCDAIIVCTGGNEIFDFPAGYLASRRSRVPFYAYLLDQYSHMVAYVLGDSVLNRFEPWILRKAAAVITPNEFLRDEVQKRYGVHATVIHNACDLSVYEKPQTLNARDDHAVRETSIVYTGGVGKVHFDSFRNLLQAIEILKRDDIRLHLYTAQPPAELDREGIQKNVVYHQHEPVSAMPAIQCAADVLFLPLGFDPAYHEIIRTAAPGKMGEFLAARRPILVHAPADSFIAWYFRQHECGLVVDTNDPEQLAAGLNRLLSDADLQRRLSARAWERAVADFALPAAQMEFAQLLGLNIRELADSESIS